MSNSRHSKSTFRGFRSPNYTQVPDELFDELLPELSGAELKVLLYIIRRTFGFKRDRDSISLSQMLNGVHSRNGTVFDRGAGVSKPTLLQALRSLEERGIIATERRRSAEKGDEPTVYTLRFAADRVGEQKSIPPLVNKLDHGGGQEVLPPAWSSFLTTQETVIQETDRDLSNFEGSLKDMETEQRNDASWTVGETDAAQPNELGSTSARGTPVPLGEILQQRGGAAFSAGSTIDRPVTAAGEENLTRRRGRADGGSEDRERLRPFLTDFAIELGDEAPLASTITRTLTIFTTADIAPEHWGDYLYQARGLTQEHTAQIRKTARGGEEQMRRKNKMPYFLATLEQLVGLRPATREESRHPKKGK